MHTEIFTANTQNDEDSDTTSPTCCVGDTEYSCKAIHASCETNDLRKRQKQI